jgi:hypothetical protein
MYYIIIKPKPPNIVKHENAKTRIRVLFQIMHSRYGRESVSLCATHPSAMWHDTRTPRTARRGGVTNYLAVHSYVLRSASFSGC